MASSTGILPPEFGTVGSGRQLDPDRMTTRHSRPCIAGRASSGLHWLSRGRSCADPYRNSAEAGTAPLRCERSLRVSLGPLMVRSTTYLRNSRHRLLVRKRGTLQQVFELCPHGRSRDWPVPSVPPWCIPVRGSIISQPICAGRPKSWLTPRLTVKTLTGASTINDRFHKPSSTGHRTEPSRPRRFA